MVFYGGLWSPGPLAPVLPAGIALHAVSPIQNNASKRTANRQNRQNTKGGKRATRPIPQRHSVTSSSLAEMNACTARF